MASDTDIHVQLVEVDTQINVELVEQETIEATIYPSGADGRPVEFHKSATHIQWRYVGDTAWVDLVALSEIKGDTGATGATGATSTTLAASATFTGTGRDLLATATATAFSAAGVYGKEYRISAAADVVGDLYLEVSRDNTTFRRVKKVTAVQNAGAGQAFYAEINHVPSTRYARAVYINGAGAQTYFMLQETLIGG